MEVEGVLRFGEERKHCLCLFILYTRILQIGAKLIKRLLCRLELDRLSL